MQDFLASFRERLAAFGPWSAGKVITLAIVTLVAGALLGRAFAPAAPRAIAVREPVADRARTATDFESLVASESPFETARQGEQRRLVALQNALAATIAGFEGVRKATVFIAPRPAAGGLGPGAVARSASVHLELAPGHRLEASRVEAIAALVAGAEAGLRPESVAIVDDTGPRRIDAPVATVERFARDRLAALLPAGTEPAVVGRAGPDGTVDLVVTVPHDYFVAAHALGASDEPLAAFRAAEADRLAAAVREGGSRRAVADAPALGAVEVAWRYDRAIVPAAAEASAVAPAASPPFPVRTALLAALGLAVAGAVAWSIRARRVALLPEPDPEAIPETKPEPVLEDRVRSLVAADPREAAVELERWIRSGTP